MIRVTNAHASIAKWVNIIFQEIRLYCDSILKMTSKQ